MKLAFFEAFEAITLKIQTTNAIIACALLLHLTRVKQSDDRPHVRPTKSAQKIFLVIHFIPKNRDEPFITAVRGKSHP